MQRFVLFAGSNYYPAGGLDDFRGTFDSLDDAKTHLQTMLVTDRFIDWWHVARIDPTDITKVACGFVEGCKIIE